METKNNTYTTEAPPEKAILAGVDTCLLYTSDAADE
mgnify:CR=1 FL=1